MVRSTRETYNFDEEYTKLRGGIDDYEAIFAQIANGEEQDKFFVDQKDIPTGYTVEWKRRSVLGKPEEPMYYNEMFKEGWVPVPCEGSFRKYMASDYTGNTVERGGLMLMIRPKKVTDAKREQERMLANSQVADRMNTIKGTTPGELERRVQKLSRSYEPIPIPE